MNTNNGDTVKRTLKLDVPDLATLVAGLSPRDVHPALARAEEASAKLEQALAHARTGLANRERLVAELPSRIQRGEVKASALTEALRDRDAAALMVAPAESSAEQARARVAAEESSAKFAVTREFAKRVELIERAVSDLGLALGEINELAAALAAARGIPGAILSTVAWPCSPQCNSNVRTAFAGAVR